VREIPVRATEDIRFQRGMMLAQRGTRGVAIAGMHPNRTHHYGLVPVRWDGRSRAFWVSKEKLSSRHSLRDCITQPPEAELDLTIPESGGAEFSFGRNLRMFRRARGLSQGQLAAAMRKTCLERVSQTSISNWENRRDCPSGTFLEAASAALGVPAFAFFVNLECVEVCDCLSYIQGLRSHICMEETSNEV
jgi:DNA-binding transcriptional regulator YiaG